MATEQTPGYKFTHYPYNCEYGSSANVLIEHTLVDKDVSLTEMLETFEHFLRAAGFRIDGRVDIVCDEEVVDVPYRADAGLVMGADG